MRKLPFVVGQGTNMLDGVSKDDDAPSHAVVDLGVAAILLTLVAIVFLAMHVWLSAPTPPMAPPSPPHDRGPGATRSTS